MELQRDRSDNVLVVRINGRLDAQWAGHLDQELAELVRAGEHRIHLHMAGVQYMSSAGIRILLRYWRQLKGLGGTFFVVEPTPLVRSVIELAGFAQLLAADAESPADTAVVSSGEPKTQTFGAMECTVYPESPGATLICRLVGDPARIATAGFSAADAQALSLNAETFALGLGAFGENYDEAHDRFGEFLAVAGTAAYLPADGSKMPDYLIAKGAYVPQVQTLYALVGEGVFAQSVRFETRPEDPRAPLSALAQAALDIAKADRVGILMVAETAGLIGAALKRSPAGPHAAAPMFEHPGIREWLRFAPEGVCERSLALVAGVAVRIEDPIAKPYLRPLTAAPLPEGHFHAAVFTFRALPKGRLSLPDTLNALFEEQSLTGLLHLLNDHRTLTGAGESLFIRGAMWISPIQTFALAR